MIIVAGSVRVKADALDEALRLSLDHVYRSRTEPGCLLHSVHQDVEDALQLFFYEQWTDRDALDVHFAVPASGDFVNALTTLAVEPPTIEIHDVS